jgi:hypothetical protein
MDVEQLHKSSRGHGDYDKYYIDCVAYKSQSIKVHELLKITNRPELIILHAIATNDDIKKHKHIVVKISDYTQPNSIAKTEFQTGKILYTNKLDGFIKFICIFPCYDDTNKRLQKTNEPITEICNATHNNINHKYVLVMPYIQNGSIAGYEWTNKNVELLKSIIVHTVLSLASAFVKTGFLHNDLHWGNILFTTTTVRKITYVFGETTVSVKTSGHKVVITDFEKVSWENGNRYLFWTNILMFIARFDITNTPGKLFVWDDNEIRLFIKNMRDETQSIDKVLQLIQLIENSSFDISDMKPKIPYNPNIF